MRLNTRWFRGLILLALLLQNAGGALVRLRHAQEEAQGFGHADHMQAPGSGVCVPHNDSCRICRHAQTTLASQEICVRLFAQVTPREEEPHTEQTGLPSRVVPLPLGSRAPPSI